MMYFDALPSPPCAHVATAALLTADYRQVHRRGVQQLAVRAGACRCRACVRDHLHCATYSY